MYSIYYNPGCSIRKNFQKLQDQRVGLSIIQRNIRAWLTLKNWSWWKLYTRVKPLLKAQASEDETKKMEEDLKKSKEEMEKQSSLIKLLEVCKMSIYKLFNSISILLIIKYKN